ncbi:MAG: SRPBCC family protein [Bacteroidota bacterium]|nr:SRPBCC family protein [Bacteroidota bacterium]MDP4231338.1 SRPBCC family protein [Bacteroidota bacterium]MDP4236270.1 SRPBCC family protein [Bacteroidota bacterium]
MKALKIILIVIIALVVVVFGISFIMPTKMHAERSIIIKASKASIFNNVKTYANIKKWSPWVEKDPNATYTIEGTDGTVGATWKWDGNKDVGKGEQTFTKIEDLKSTESSIHFIKPWEGHATSYVTLADTAGGVQVVWGFNSEMSRPWNVMGLFMNMDKAIGSDFEKGLGKLKDLSEKESASGTGGPSVIKEMSIEPKTYVGIKKTMTFDKITSFFAEYYPQLFADLQKSGIQLAGAPAGLYYAYDQTKMTTLVAAVAPVMNPKTKIGKWETFNVKGGKAVELDYYGGYQNLGKAHQQINAYLAEKKLKSVAPVIEEYLSDPMSEKDTAKWLTKIYYLVE